MPTIIKKQNMPTIIKKWKKKYFELEGKKQIVLKFG